MVPKSVPIPIPGGLASPLPQFVTVRQNFSLETLADIDGAVAEQFRRFSHVDLAGKTVAVGVGSRGIRQQPIVVKALIGHLKAAGADPFLFPAMGSHGGGSAEGQEAVLASYGFTEATMGAPVRSSLEVVELDTLDDGTPVYCDKLASEADWIVVCNRVKPHTSFRAEHESGLVKMLAIGAAKHAGATALHFHGMENFDRYLPAAAGMFLDRANVLFGVAMVENAREDMRHLEFVGPEAIFERDAALLEIAKASIPRLFFDAMDVLIVDQIGKDISGAGLDPNVTGRTAEGGTFDGCPSINRIVLRDLTDKTEGNATGLGIGDVTTQKFAAKIDWTKTYVNIVTSGSLSGAKLPLVADNDRDAIGIAIRGCAGVHPEDARIVRIRNSLEMTNLWASVAMIAQIEGNPDLQVTSDPFDCVFDDDGNILGAIDLD